MIKSEQFQDAYRDLLEIMLESHAYEGSDFVAKGDLPEIGYIAFEGCIPVACGFLRRVEGSLCLFDGLVSNRTMPKAMCDEGLNLVVQSLVAHAKSIELKGILAYSSNISTLNRAVETGFILDEGARVFFKPL